jgi:prepilin-type N-terminal cleavage/methylation domain-containing protein
MTRKINNLQFTIYNSAFTLIELLVVISIIGILAGMVVVSFTSSQKQARDTQRKSDLAQYRTTLEGYANRTNGLYPIYGSSTSLSGTVCPIIDPSSGNCPEDPKSPTVIYRYCSNTAGTDYVLWTTLEKASSMMWATCSSGNSATSAVAPACGGTFNCFP